MSENIAFQPEKGKHLAYDNKNRNVWELGYLYDWQTANTICPAGWHLPTDEEWKQLEEYLGGSSIAGAKLKSETGWDLYKSANYGNNESGFNAMPGGYADSSDKFIGKGNYAWFWTATPDNTNAWCRILHYGQNKIQRATYKQNYACSVRCVKDK